jgi:ribonuclease G
LADWLVERGIGEDRALLVEDGQVHAAKLRWSGELHAGQLADAKLVSRRG